VPVTTHTKYVCKGGHDHPSCVFCGDGLFTCTVCGGFEDSLPTDCPLVKMTHEQQVDIHSGNLDYRDGRGWCKPDGTGRSMGDMEYLLSHTENTMISHECVDRPNLPCQACEAGERQTPVEWLNEVYPTSVFGDTFTRDQVAWMVHVYVAMEGQ
jgi:hypothetical protein